MTNVTVTSSVIQGAPVVTATTIVRTFAVANGYYIQGQVIDSALLGSPDVINTLIGLGAISMTDPLLSATATMAPRAASQSRFVTTASLTTSP